MPTPKERSARALDALRHHAGEDSKRQSLEECITDLLTNLRHLCCIEEIDFEESARCSEYHYEEERGGEG